VPITRTLHPASCGACGSDRHGSIRLRKRAVEGVDNYVEGVSRGKREALVLVVLIVVALYTRTLLLLVVGGVAVGLYHWWAGRRFEQDLRRQGDPWQGYGDRGDE